MDAALKGALASRRADEIYGQVMAVHKSPSYRRT